MPHPTRLFNTPEDLSKVWDEFKVDLKEQSKEWTKTHYVGRDGEQKNEMLKVPMTFEGFKRFCRNNYGEVEQYFTNQNDYYKEFVGICRAIKEEIREQQIIGGLLNIYNSSITQRLNGLTDKQEVTQKVEQPIFGDTGEDD